MRLMLALFSAMVVLSLPALATPTPTADPLAVVKAAKTFQVTLTISTYEGGVFAPRATLILKAQSPNLIRAEYGPPSAQAAPVKTVLGDGKNVYQLDSGDKTYVKADYPDGFSPADLASQNLVAMSSGDLPENVTLDGKPVWLYKRTLPSRDDTPQVLDVWSDQTTNLPVRISVLSGKDTAQKEVVRLDYSDWKIDEPIDPSVFTWNPPAGVTEQVEPKVIANGTQAPDFTVQDKSGKPVKLSDYRGKVVVLDFWATWCGPCQQSLPFTNDVAKAHKDVVFLAVNVWDTKDAFIAWLPKHTNLSALSFAIDTSDQGKDIASTLYGVSGIPTQFVIDKSGKVVHSIVGFGGSSDDLIAAVKAAQNS